MMISIIVSYSFPHTSHRFIILLSQNMGGGQASIRSGYKLQSWQDAFYGEQPRLYRLGYDGRRCPQSNIHPVIALKTQTRSALPASYRSLRRLSLAPSTIRSCSASASPSSVSFSASVCSSCSGVSETLCPVETGVGSHRSDSGRVSAADSEGTRPSSPTNSRLAWTQSDCNTL